MRENHCNSVILKNKVEKIFHWDSGSFVESFLVLIFNLTLLI